jgi:DNA uptake protein ComE-like DNA-binding protein
VRPWHVGKIIFVTGLWCLLPWSIPPGIASGESGGIGRDPQADRQAVNGRGASDFGERQVDLNRATVEELLALPSIGPVLAKRIIDHRRRHGRFRRPEEVIIVPGMSATRYRRIAHLLVAGPDFADDPARTRARPTRGGRDR